MRDFLRVLLTDLLYFGFPNGFIINRARSKKNGMVTLKLKSLPHPFTLRCGTSDFETFDQVFISREYNIKLELRQHGWIIDGGANIGLASLYFTQRFPDCRILAIEAEKSNYDLLVQNTAGYPNITCQHAALWNEKTNLEVHDESRDKWGFTVGHGGINPTHTVQAHSVHDLMNSSGIDMIDVLKLDIEGAEVELFSKNYESWIPRTKVILVELHDDFRPDSSRTFFTTILKYDFLISVRGEKIVARQRN